MENGARGWQDFKGCLTPAGFKALAQAAPGRAPAEIVRHVAECAHCQRQALAADLSVDRNRRRRAPTTPRRLLVLGLLFLLLMLCVLWSIQFVIRG